MLSEVQRHTSGQACCLSGPHVPGFPDRNKPCGRVSESLEWRHRRLHHWSGHRYLYGTTDTAQLSLHFHCCNFFCLTQLKCLFQPMYLIYFSPVSSHCKLDLSAWPYKQSDSLPRNIFCLLGYEKIVIFLHQDHSSLLLLFFVAVRWIKGHREEYTNDSFRDWNKWVSSDYNNKTFVI